MRALATRQYLNAGQPWCTATIPTNVEQFVSALSSLLAIPQDINTGCKDAATLAVTGLLPSAWMTIAASAEKLVLNTDKLAGTGDGVP
jgi:hypothetical protein